jgi:hypothetical protein
VTTAPQERRAIRPAAPARRNLRSGRPGLYGSVEWYGSAALSWLAGWLGPVAQSRLAAWDAPVVLARLAQWDWLVALSRSARWLRSRWRRQDGSATAELAASLPALVLLLFAALTAVTAVRTQLECVDAAREAARAAARGESGEVAGGRVAPTGSSVSITIEGDTARATVRVRLDPLGGHLPGFNIAATAVAAIEPDITGPDEMAPKAIGRDATGADSGGP